jgi:RNA polymerase-binding transcription factor DksA
VTDSAPEPTTSPPPPPAEPDASPADAIGDVGTPSDAMPELDLDAVERDLAAVETALQRLSDGTYWTDEVTGEPIPEHVLVADPTARRS